jgi:hypothetical protein
MKLLIKKGSASKTVQFFVNDTSVTNGGGLSGLSSGSASLTAYYYREGNTVTTSLPMTNSSLGVWASGGIVPVDGTNMPGLYQLGLPDAALATGASSVVVMVRGAANMAPVLMEVQLTDFDPSGMAMADISSVPAITCDPFQALNWLFVLARNKRAQNSTTETVYKDDGSTAIATSGKSDDGATFTRGEFS